MHLMIIIPMALLYILQPVHASTLSEFDAMICQLEANIAVVAANDRIKGVSLQESMESVKKKLSMLNDVDNDLTTSINTVMSSKITDVYSLYSLELIKKPNFRSYIHGLCLSDLLPPNDSSTPVDDRFIEKMTNTFKLALAGSIPKELLDKVSSSAAICLLSEYRSENNKAIDEFIAYVAEGKPILDSQKLIAQSYIEDDEAIAAFMRVNTSSKACVESALRVMVGG